MSVASLLVACAVSSVAASTHVFHGGGGAASRSDTIMAAVVATAFGKAHDFSHITYSTATPIPKPGIGQVLIRVNASSVNPVDWKIVEKGQGFEAILKVPHTLGFDLAGTVVQIEGGSSRLMVGDAVWADVGDIWPLRGGELGAYAQYAIANEKQVSIMPHNIGFVEAASLPLVSLTSYQALKKAGAPWPSSRNATVLVTSGSGGTGFVGVQLAKALGAAWIISVADTAHIEFVKSMGADVVYDYTKGDVFDQLQNNSVDIVYDNYGAAGTADKAMRTIRNGGVFIFLPGKDGGGVSKHPKAGVKQINYGFCDSSGHADLDDLRALVEGGQLRPHVEQTFPMRDIRSAFNLSQTGTVVGKIGISL